MADSRYFEAIQTIIFADSHAKSAGYSKAQEYVRPSIALCGNFPFQCVMLRNAGRRAATYAPKARSTARQAVAYQSGM